MPVKIKVRCVSCKHKWEIDSDDAREVQTCPECFSPAIIDSAEYRGDVARQPTAELTEKNGPREA